jgi:type IV pilus assembly protein PilW
MSSRRHRARGFSLVELLVSVVLGMLAIVFATRLFVSSEQNKSAAIGGSDSMQMGLVAFFSFCNDARLAGWGLNDTLLAGCDTTLTDTLGFVLPTVARGGVDTTPLAPVIIESGGTSTDRITLMAGSAMSGVGSERLRDNYAGAGSVNVATTQPFGFLQDSVVVLAPEPAGGKCALAQLSDTPPGFTLNFAVDGARRFNRAALGNTYNAGQARVYNLGPVASLAFHTWSVSNGNLLLRATDLAGTSAAPAAVVDNVVAIKAQYGFDTRAASAFDPSTGMQVGAWSAAMMNADGDAVTGGAGDIQRIAAVRLAVIARSKMPEKPNPVTRQCSATTAPLTIFSGRSPATVAANPVTVNLDVVADWQCYRYRVFETIVPLRNAAWRP